MAVFLAVEAAHGLGASHLTSTERSERAQRPDHPAALAPLTQANSVRDQTAAWVASQVSAGAIVACDPVMCSVLVRYGFPAANLLVLGTGAPDPLGSEVVVATPAVRDMFGTRLVTVYAPQTVASFGTGSARIDVRAVAPNGAAAYQTALAADLRARRAAGLELLRDRRVTGSAAAPATSGADSLVPPDCSTGEAWPRKLTQLEYSADGVHAAKDMSPGATRSSVCPFSV